MSRLTGTQKHHIWIGVGSTAAIAWTLSFLQNGKLLDAGAAISMAAWVTFEVSKTR